jgi:hypothetical protein
MAFWVSRFRRSSRSLIVLGVDEPDCRQEAEARRLAADARRLPRAFWLVPASQR